MSSLTIATPFFNEEDGLVNFFDTQKKIYDLINNKISTKFLFINDGSTDSTKQKLYDYKVNNPKYDIDIFTHENNFGYGRTLKNSIKLCNTKYLITYDSDCSYDYNIIKKLVDEITKQDYEIINVSFKLAKKKLNLSLFRKVLSWGASCVNKIFFPEIKEYQIKVFTCSFRIYNVEKIKDIKLISDDFNCCAELMIRAMIKKLKIKEIAGENLGRQFGKSKMKVIKNTFNTLKTIFLIKIKS